MQRKWTCETAESSLEREFTRKRIALFKWARKWKCQQKLMSTYLVWLLLSKRWLTDCFLLVTRLCRIIAATDWFVFRNLITESQHTATHFALFLSLVYFYSFCFVSSFFCCCFTWKHTVSKQFLYYWDVNVETEKRVLFEISTAQ